MQARTAEESGNHEAAVEYRRKARNWNIAGIVGGVAVIVISIIVLAIVLGVVVPLYVRA